MDAATRRAPYKVLAPHLEAAQAFAAGGPYENTALLNALNRIQVEVNQQFGWSVVAKNDELGWSFQKFQDELVAQFKEEQQ